MAIGSIMSVAAALPTQLATATPGVSAAGGAGAGAGGGFGDVLSKALDSVSASNNQADQLAVQAATGDLNAVHDYTIAATEAQLLTQLTVEIRNRAVDAFNDIMHMQV